MYDKQKPQNEIKCYKVKVTLLLFTDVPEYQISFDPRFLTQLRSECQSILVYE